ncbi:hypothetical protein CQ06_07610 [Ralstonia solanacearum]|nr:hypothetical protein CQ06_07610 [Ralstonia solanacearum]
MCRRAEPQRQIDGLVAYHGILPDLDPRRVEEHDRIHGIEWSGLPCGDFAHHLIGDRADELGRDFRCILLQQEALDLAHGHAPGIHGDDLVVEALEASLVFGNEQRFEAAITVTRHLDADRTVLGQNRLGA